MANIRTVRELTYNAEIALNICMRIAKGETLTEVCRDKNMPTYTTVLKWRVTYPEFEEAYENARRISAFALEDEALLAARKLAGPNNFNAPRVSAMAHAMNQLRWSATKRNVKEFGDVKPGATVIPIQINTTLDLGQGGVAPMESDVYTLAAEYRGNGESNNSSNGENADASAEADTTVYTGDLTVPEAPKRLLLGRHSEEYRALDKAEAAKKKHKTPAQIAATKAAHAIRNNRKARETE